MALEDIYFRNKKSLIMARKVIITIVSEQTVPNVLFIKDFGTVERYIFVSSQKMESPSRKTTEKIIHAAGIANSNFKIIEVIEDSLLDIDLKLTEDLDLEDDDEIFVNITGGTKLMSLGVYNYFSRSGAADIFYIPLGKNEIRQVFPLRKKRVKALDFRINLLDYLKAYGVEVKEKSFNSKNLLLKPEMQTQKLFQSFISPKRIQLFSVAEEIRKKEYRGKKIRKSEEKESQLFQNALVFLEAGVQFDNDMYITEKETKYFTGEWFEEYLYPILKNALKKNDDEIGMGVQLVKGDTPNEYDIIYTHNNSLYVIECKTDIADNEEGKINNLFTNTLYKAATLKKEFGLWVNYFLFALNDFSKLKQEQKSRAKLLEIKLVGLEVLSDEETLLEYITNM
jgi:hypothetical protein